MSLFRYDPPAEPAFRDLYRASHAQGPVVCGTCGCRLEPSEAAGDPAGAWRHFEGLPGRDARGCRVVCVDLVHDRGGSARE
jgi:hypothetical protein